MPIYEYVCQKCSEKQEHIVKNYDVDVNCKKCGHDKLSRLFPIKTNFKLIGSGWYGTGG